MDRNMPRDGLRAGFGAVDITPPVGLPMAGALDPRTNRGTSDPLLAKAIHVEGIGGTATLVGLDLIGVPRHIADAAIREASRRAGLDPASIMISASHTHSGPYMSAASDKRHLVDEAYLASLPGRIADSIVAAVEARQPAVFSLGRSLVYRGIYHRRVIAKHDGLAINAWMRGLLNDLDAVPQVLGAAGVIDPELWVARFDAPDGGTLGFLVNFSLHVNSRFGELWSADYPGVIAARLAEAFGGSIVSVFTPGACANVNPTYAGEEWIKGAEFFAAQAVDAARRARRIEGPIHVGASRLDLTVPRRDPQSQREGAIDRLNWGSGAGRQDVFGPLLKWVAEMPEQLNIPVSAARIGPLGIASNAGELFVEWGLDIKRRSPFKHTIISQLTNDTLGYQPDKAGFAAEGYETLIGANRISPEGIGMLVDSAVSQLERLAAATTTSARKEHA